MKISFISALAIVSLVSVQPAFAVSGSTSANPLRPTIMKEAREAMETKRQEIRAESEATRAEHKQANEKMRLEKEAERCTKLNTTIDTRVKKFEEHHAGRRKQLNIVRLRVLEFVSRRDAKGVDTSAVKSALEVYNSKFDKLNADHTAYIEKLKATKQFACPGPQDESRAQFKAALQETRDAQRVVFEDTKDIAAYFKNTVKPALDAIRPAPGTVEKPLPPRASSPATLLPVENR
ncbi:MAG: hypothetical protein WCJ70_02490 [bacterium]